MKYIIINLIKIYKRLIAPFWAQLSPIHHSPCRYWPSCSEYALESVSRFGAVRGTLKSLKRILRCQPFSKGGIDLVI